MDSRGEVTRLLSSLSAGERDAEEQLIPIIYSELHSLAQNLMRSERTGHTLQATALVHEAYLRLWGSEGTDWESRAHFLRVAARAMRRVLIDHARRKQADKREGGRKKLPLDEAAAVTEIPPPTLLDFDKALTNLSSLDPRMAQVVELRYFGGLSVEDTARIMEVTPRTVMRFWRSAKAWLAKEIDA